MLSWFRLNRDLVATGHPDPKSRSRRACQYSPSVTHVTSFRLFRQRNGRILSRATVGFVLLNDCVRQWAEGMAHARPGPHPEGGLGGEAAGDQCRRSPVEGPQAAPRDEQDDEWAVAERRCLSETSTARVRQTDPGQLPPPPAPGDASAADDPPPPPSAATGTTGSRRAPRRRRHPEQEHHHLRVPPTLASQPRPGLVPPARRPARLRPRRPSLAPVLRRPQQPLAQLRHGRADTPRRRTPRRDRRRPTGIFWG
jgi:hypothetical protein